VIRFSAFLVVVAVGLLIAGVVTSKLMLVYIAIGVSGVALLALGVGVAVNWRELTSKAGTTAAEAGAPGPAASPQLAASSAAVSSAAASSAAQPQASVPAAVAVPSGPSRAGYLPTEHPLEAQPFGTQPAAAEPPGWPPIGAPRSPADSPARDVWKRSQPVDPKPAAPQPVPQPAVQPAETSAAAEAPAPPTPPADQSAGQAQPSPEDQPLADSADAEPGTVASEPEPASAASATVVGSAATSPTDQEDQTQLPGQVREPEPTGPDPSMEVTVVPGVPRYHNARCILIRFMGEKDLDKMTLAAAGEAGCTPCRACLPDQPEKSPE
jgi:hypothetical protein